MTYTRLTSAKCHCSLSIGVCMTHCMNAEVLKGLAEVRFVLWQTLFQYLYSASSLGSSLGLPGIKHAS